jgi:hypothetical protein
VPRAARQGWPLLVAEERIAWVCGLRLDERFAIRESTSAAWCVRFSPKNQS